MRNQNRIDELINKPRAVHNLVYFDPNFFEKQ